MSGKSSTRGAAGPPVLRPEAAELLRIAETAIRHLDPKADRWDNSVGFRSDAGYTVFRVHPVDETAHDGRQIAERIMLRTSLPVGLELTDAELLKANLMASIGAVVRDPETGELLVLSSAAVTAGDDRVLRLLGALFLHCAPDHAASVAPLIGRPVPDGPGGEAQPEADGTRCWQPGEFAAARDGLPAQGIAAELSPGRLDAWLPVAPGLPPRWAAAFPPSRLMVTANAPHPWLGNGLTTLLELPPCCEPEEAGPLVNKLNWWEWFTPGAAPFAGAWTCLPGAARPTFITFVPDAAWHPSLLRSLVAWAVTRAGVARRWVLQD